MRPIDADALKQMIDFRMWDVDDDYPHDEASNKISEDHAVKKIIDEMPTIDAEPQWIPVSERLPKMKEIVLITNDKGHVRCGQYRGIGSFSKNDGRPHWNWKGNTLETVVAWMPLPEPYRGEE